MTRFADAAARLAGMAGAAFGWRPEEFWRATPDELATLVRAIADPSGHGGEAAPPGRDAVARLMEAFPDD